MRLKSKMTSTFLACGLIPLAIAITVSLWIAKSGFNNIESNSSVAVQEQVSDQLTAIRDLKKSQIENYFGTIKNQILSFSEDEAVITAMEKFQVEFKDHIGEVEVTDADIADMKKQLQSYYTKEFGPEYKSQNSGKESPATEWLNSLDREGIVFQSRYIKNNSNPLGSKHLLDTDSSGSQYSQTHAQYHPMIRSYLERFGYYDIFLVEPETGDIVYSVFKELDYATSLIDGPHKNTNFAECFRRANDLKDPNSFVIVDYKQYGPSYEAPASFIASPVFRGDKKIGIAMFQMPIDYVNEVMSLRTGMGETGETYLVGPDNLMRCDSFHDPENRSISASFRNPEKGSVRTESISRALAGDSGTELVTNYAGAEVLSAYTPVNVLGNKWALVAELGSEEALGAVTDIQNTSASATGALVTGVTGICAFATFGIAFIGWWFSGKITGPILKIADEAKKIAKGDLSGDVSIESNDEVGELASSFQDMKKSIGKMSQETTELVSKARQGDFNAQSDSKQFGGCYKQLIENTNDLVKAFGEPVREVRDTMKRVSDGDLTTRMNGKYAGEFEHLANSINQAIGQIETALSEVSTTTGDVSKAAGEVNRSSQNIAEGSTEQASSLEEIASSLEEMTSMTKQSSENATQAKLLAKETRQAADAGKSSMTQMSEAIEKIKNSSDEQAKIVRTIDEIAFQTNLLALNAAVEAARAGEAGKGFAVVAEEVRSLAQRSAEAARTTSSMIEASVESSNNGVSISQEVAETLEQILNSAQKTDDLVAEIAAAAKEQSQGIDQVNTAIGQLDSTTQTAAEASQSSAEVASTLSRNVDELRRLVSRFKVKGGSSPATKMLEEINDRVNKPSPKPAPSRAPEPEAAPVAAGGHDHAEDLIPFGDDDDFGDF